MRACAILLDSMVLSLWMSSGRTMPATISSRISKLTRISWRPSTTRLPFGSTWVTTAATLVCKASERLTEPLPSLEEVESAVRIRPGGMAVAGVRKEGGGAVAPQRIGIVGGRLRRRHRHLHRLVARPRGRIVDRRQRRLLAEIFDAVEGRAT